MSKQLLISFLAGIITVNILPLVCFGQNISTIAGCGIGNDSLATRAELFSPMGVATDNAGVFYIADPGNLIVRQVDAAGVITTFAGTGMYGYSGDGGQATAANIGEIWGVKIDKAGNKYLADITNSVIRKVSPDGIITTIAGTGTAGYNGDNIAATSAQLNGAADIAVDTLGNVYIADRFNFRVRKVDTAGIITTVTGNGSAGSSNLGGPATAASIGYPFRITLDKTTGNLYIATYYDWHILKINTGDTITSIAGTGSYGYTGDGGPATAATMSAPCGISTDTSGNVYFSDIDNNRIRKIDITTGIITSFAANGVAGYAGDSGPASAAEISSPEGITFDSLNNLYISDFENNRIRKVAANGTMTTFAGQNGLFDDGYPGANTELGIPSNLATDAAGNIYIADIYNNRIRKIDAVTGIVTTVAGDGIAGYGDGFSGDGGPATAAHIYNPAAVAVDNSGNIYIADEANQRIRKVNTSGIITTIAGNGTAGYTGGNFAATTEELNYPAGVAVDNAGNVYIADEDNNRIRKISTSGIMSTIAGAANGYSGDGGPAVDAELSYPADVSLDGSGNLYICDEGNSCIRKIDTAGIITTVAGTGDPGFTGDGGDAIYADLYYPDGVKADSAGNIFISDGNNQRIRVVTTDGIINTIAGNGTAGFSGDGGPAVAAMLNGPSGVAIDKMGNLFVADGNNDRVRKVGLTLSVPTVNKNALANVMVYPNPTHGIMNIENAENAEAVMYDVLGAEVMRKPVSSAKEILNISSLASGIYILHVTNNNGDEKIVKVTKE